MAHVCMRDSIDIVHHMGRVHVFLSTIDHEYLPSLDARRAIHRCFSITDSPCTLVFGVCVNFTVGLLLRVLSPDLHRVDYQRHTGRKRGAIELAGSVVFPKLQQSRKHQQLFLIRPERQTTRAKKPEPQSTKEIEGKKLTSSVKLRLLFPPWSL
jgi:hypothetical protein